MDYPLLIAFTIGLFSTLHCLGMCSGIIGALTLSLPSEIHQNRRRLLPYVLAYNTGRVASYTLAGALMGGISGGLFQILSPNYGYYVLQGIAALVLLAIGLYLAGWFPKLSKLEALGQPIWQRLEPIGRRLMPVKSPTQALMFGAVWGWLPCGLVYTTLLWAASAGSVTDSALLMLAFGLGTLPTVISAGIISSWIVRLSQSMRLRRAAGLSLIIMALIAPIYAVQEKDHRHAMPAHGEEHYHETQH